MLALCDDGETRRELFSEGAEIESSCRDVSGGDNSDVWVPDVTMEPIVASGFGLAHLRPRASGLSFVLLACVLPASAVVEQISKLTRQLRATEAASTTLCGPEAKRRAVSTGLAGIYLRTTFVYRDEAMCTAGYSHKL